MNASTVPRAVARALRQVGGHPAVRHVEVVSVGEATEAVVEVRVQLGSRWQAAGASPNGVRGIEPVTMRFDRAFPVTAPKFLLRADFNRAHPHLQPRPDDDPPEPCLTAGSPAELMRSRGMHGLVDQLVLWLERAARVELIAPQQGWEPTRRDQIDDIVVLDGEWLRQLPGRESEAHAFEAVFMRHEARGARSYAVAASTRKTPLRQTLLQDLVASRPPTLCLVAWSGKLPSGHPFVADQYEPENVCDVAGLHRRAARLGCGPVLASQLQLLQSRLRAGRVERPIPVGIVLMARRPCPVIGEGSPWELIPYIVEISGVDDLGAESTTPVRIAVHRQAIGPELLRRVSGDWTGVPPKSWTLLGCGSVGSKIALHFARAGRAPAHLVDKAWMAAHNYARHALVPLGRNEGMVLMPKGFLLAKAIEGLGQEAAFHDCDVAAGWRSLPVGALSADEAAFIVNATASLSVREALAAGASNTRARVIEAGLLAVGQVGWLAVEGPGGNPSSTDLAVEAYRMLLEEPETARKVFDGELSEIAVGQGCSSLTMPVSDARVSAFAAPMAERIGTWHADGLPGGVGSIAIGALESDGMSQGWRRRDIEPWIVVGGHSSAIQVRLSPNAHKKIAAAVEARPGVETGGVLIGRWSDVAGAFHVADVLTAPADSVFSRNLFVLGIEGLSELINEVVTRTHGTLYPLGTWHCHLAASGPSGLDRRTAQVLARQQQIPMLLLIHTPAGYRFLVAEPMSSHPTGAARLET